MFVKIEVFLVETLLTTLPCIFNLLFYNLLRLVIIIIMYIEMKILSPQLLSKIPTICKKK